MSIGDRFCIWNGLSLTTLNGIPGSMSIQPGLVLVLDPAAVPGFVFDYPYDDRAQAATHAAFGLKCPGTSVVGRGAGVRSRRSARC